MPNYRRWYVPGGTYFFTVVTHNRQHILTSALARKCLRETIQQVQSKTPFETIAIVLLPDHLHTVWTLPPGETDYSGRWGQIKEAFTRAYLKRGGQEGSRDASRVRKRERGVWQHRFWEHVVRDEQDLSRCLDYIHWNPVKHGLVKRVADYRWSSFFQWVERGEYDMTWGEGEVADILGAEWE